MVADVISGARSGSGAASEGEGPVEGAVGVGREVDGEEGAVAGGAELEVARLRGAELVGSTCLSR